MKFSIIYSVDIPSGVNMRPFVPPRCKELWNETEDDSSYEYGYLEGSWTHGHHRKWCAILTLEEFEEFLFHVGLHAESCQTMGSIGAPGYGFGWAPAISFTNDDPDAIQSAYVTPSGTAAEIASFLAEHDVVAPPILMDDPSQGYLWEGIPEYEGPQVWESLRECVIADYEGGI